MATLKNGLLSGFSGRVGNIVGCEGKTGFYIRRLPAKTTKPPTVKQLAQREKFKLAQSFLSGLRELFKMLPDIGKKQVTAFNGTLSRVVKEGITGDYPGQSIDYAAVKLTSGRYYNGFNHTVAAVQNILTFSWLDDVRIDIYQVAIVLAYNPLQGLWVYRLCPITSKSNQAVLELPEDFTGQPVETFIYFMTNDCDEVSASVYTGQVS